MITPRQCLRRDWTKLLGIGPLGIGLDLATTEKETSNPSSLTVTEKSGPLFIERLVLRWKTADERITRAIVQCVFEDLAAAQLRPKGMNIDASNERFFAQSLQRQFSRYCPIHLIVAGENVPNLVIDGLPVTWKEYQGNLYVNSFIDARMRTPNATWLKDDRRLVKKEKGRFVADTAPDGSHADTFDSGKQARAVLEGRGRAEASGTPVGSSGQPNRYAGLRNPLLHLAQRNAQRRTAS